MINNLQSLAYLLPFQDFSSNNLITTKSCYLVMLKFFLILVCREQRKDQRYQEIQTFFFISFKGSQRPTVGPLVSNNSIIFYTFFYYFTLAGRLLFFTISSYGQEGFLKRPKDAVRAVRQLPIKDIFVVREYRNNLILQLSYRK